LVSSQGEEEQIVAFREWWSENGTSIIVSVAVVVAAVVGWRWYSEHRSARAEAASTVYEQYLEARAANTDTTASLATLDKEHPNTSYRVFTLFYRAADAVKEEKYSDAAPLLKEAIDVADDERLKDIARVRYAKVLAQLGEQAKALEQLTAIRGAGFRSTAAELKGDILMAQGDVKGAAAAYQAAVDAKSTDDAGAAESGRQDPMLEAKLADATRTDASQ
jgi:predicted negative regulator of RcsB-dependent stress response